MERGFPLRIHHRSDRSRHGPGRPLRLRRGGGPQPKAHKPPPIRYGRPRGDRRTRSICTATGAADLGQESWGTATSSYGACDFWSPRQYRFVYIHDSRASDVAFVNTVEVPIRDDAGDLFYHASMDLPIRLTKPQSVVLQF